MECGKSPRDALPRGDLPQNRYWKFTCLDGDRARIAM
jgi:hypothetical protein